MMKIPNLTWIYLDPRKITSYLLSETHERGKSKCKFFQGFGFFPNKSYQLEIALKNHPIENEIAEIKPTEFGTRYIVRCRLQSPDGRNPCIVSVWQENADFIPEFITAYPG